MQSLNERRKAAGYEPIPAPGAQYMIVYYWRPACSCGWQSERIFHLGEEEKSNLVFDQHFCQGEKSWASLGMKEEIDVTLKAGITYTTRK